MAKKKDGLGLTTEAQRHEGPETDPSVDVIDPAELIGQERDGIQREAIDVPLGETGTVVQTTEQAAAIVSQVVNGETVEVVTHSIVPPLPPDPAMIMSSSGAIGVFPLDGDVRPFNAVLPVFAGEPQQQHGYLSARVDTEMTGDMGRTFRRLLLGLRTVHATYTQNGRLVHVDNANDVIRWLVHGIIQAEKDQQPLGGLFAGMQQSQE